MHQEILIPTDGSEESMTAVEEGLEMADAHGASVHTLYVVDESIRARGLIGMEHPGLLPTLRQIGEDATNEIKSQCEQAGIDVTTAIREGVPHESILSYADENDIDMIVMSSHGRSGVNRILLGSVTERVIRSTDLPVLVVRGTAAETEPEARTDVESDSQA